MSPPHSPVAVTAFGYQTDEPSPAESRGVISIRINTHHLFDAIPETTVMAELVYVPNAGVSVSDQGFEPDNFGLEFAGIPGITEPGIGTPNLRLPTP